MVERFAATPGDGGDPVPLEQRVLDGAVERAERVNVDIADAMAVGGAELATLSRWEHLDDRQLPVSTRGVDVYTMVRAAEIRTNGLDWLLEDFNEVVERGRASDRPIATITLPSVTSGLVWISTLTRTLSHGQLATGLAEPAFGETTLRVSIDPVRETARLRLPPEMTGWADIRSLVSDHPDLVGEALFVVRASGVDAEYTPENLDRELRQLSTPRCDVEPIADVE